MLKIIPPGSYDLGEPVVQMVKLSSRGLIGNDRREFLKRASHTLLDQLSNIKLAAGEVPLHVVPMGSTEGYGCNRNGDGFDDYVCRTYHPTYVKLANWFRHHQNKDPKKGRGHIKLSAFNEDMKRIELIAALYSTKEAADRRGGLIADIELEKLARGEDPPVSMGCHVSHDICSGCGNKARFRSEYCDEDSGCKYGGLKGNIGRTFDDGKTAFAINPDPHWFDLSLVGRNADRIAFGLGVVDGYGNMLKAASFDGYEKTGGADMANRMGLSTPAWVYESKDPWMLPRTREQFKVAAQLLEAEEAMHLNMAKFATLSLAFRMQQPAKELPDVRHEKLGAVLAALQQAGCLLPLTEFVSLLSREPREKIAAVTTQTAAALPGTFNRLVSLPDFEQRLLDNPYFGTETPSSKLQSWAVKQASDWSVQRDRVVERLQLATIRQVQPHAFLTKHASFSAKSEELANEYGLYVLAFLASQPDTAERKTAAELVVHSNYCQ